MSKANEAVSEQEENHGLGDFIDEYERDEAEQERIENQPDASEVKRAQELAEKMNSSFLWLVNRTQCPHVALKTVVDQAEGDEAFYGLAEKWGGEVPPWMEAVQPYIAAGVYMGVTIAVARDAEAQVVAEAKRQHDAKQGPGHGDQ